jgi:uncharacterized protein YjbI with pentapeptide repeats
LPSSTLQLAEASLRGAWLSGTSLSGILILVGASLHGVSVGDTLGFADASLRGELSDTSLLADSLLRGVSFAENAANGTTKFLERDCHLRLKTSAF